MSNPVADLRNKRIVAAKAEQPSAATDGSVAVDSLWLTLDDGTVVFAYTAEIEPPKRVG